LQAALLFVPSLVLSVLVGLAMEQLFGAIVVGLEQPVWLIEYFRAAIATLLSGQLLPLAYYPAGIGEIFAWLPFAAMAWAPLAIYTGAGNPLSLLASQVIWAIVLWPLANQLWRRNREKLAGHGG
jgi:ABC-2 type transport system permease protein